jgi:uncharacterized protein YkwD
MAVTRERIGQGIAIVVAIGAVVWLASGNRLPTAQHKVSDGGCAHGADVPAGDNLAGIRAATLCLLNKQRASHGLRPLTENRRLERAAQRFSNEMTARHFFEHVSPDGSTPLQRVKASGYTRVRLAGENLGWGIGRAATPFEMVDGWMHSPGHRANILRRDFKDIGIGVTDKAPQDVGDQKAATYTTDFGAPRR